MGYVVVDIETTGLSRMRHHITEIAAARVINGKVERTFQTLINPRAQIPRFITKLTGIDNDMVKDAPYVEEILPAFLKFLGKNVFVAHNAGFDFGFLNHNLQRHYGGVFGNEKLCTRKLANRLLPELPSKKLGVVCDHFGVVNSAAHRAMGDVEATVKVFDKMLSMLKGKGFTKKEDVLLFESMPLYKASRIMVNDIAQTRKMR